MIVLEILGHILLWCMMLIGILIIPIGVPGTFVILASAFIYAWITGFAVVTWSFLGILLLIAIAAEVLEFFLGAATAGKYGASKAGMVGAIVGGFTGAIWATPIFPLIGTVIGAFVGAFAGAALFEYFVTKDLEKSLTAGLGAFLGSVGGKLTKIAAAVAMVVMVGFRVY